MTVQELINELEQFDPDYEINIYDEYNGCSCLIDEIYSLYESMEVTIKIK